MKVTVLLFGPASEAAGVDRATMELPDKTTVSAFRQHLEARFPALRTGAGTLRFAINESFASPDQSLSEGDEIAVIPPVSGGGEQEHDDLIVLTESPLSIDAIQARLGAAPADRQGGVCTFEGRTRLEQHEQHGRLVGLAYEAYRSMALQQMRDLAEHARKKWPIGSLAILHRIGLVPVGEPSVMIAVACAHRSDAFAACRWLIDQVKLEVPIWKKEQWQSGDSSWVQPTDRRSSAESDDSG